MERKTEMKKATEKKDKIIKMKAKDVQQFANALETAIRASADQVVNGQLMWWAGWQLGQTRKFTSEYEAAVKHPRIQEMQKVQDKKDFDVSNSFPDAIGMIDAANGKECSIRVRQPEPEWFEGDAPLAFAKVLSYLDIEM
jgi:hypothetical protein